MLGPKTGLRLLVTVITAAITFAAPSIGAYAAPSEYANTLTFISGKFIEGKTLDGLSPGSPDYGFTLEAMLQRKALGQKLLDQLPAVKANLADTTVFSRSAVSNYAYSVSGTSKTIRPGIAGKFLFVSAALGVPNAPLRNSLVADLKAAVGSNGLITAANGNTFDYAWAILGLAANNQQKLANTVAQKLASLQHSDGGFGTDQTGNSLKSSGDSTGIALQSISYAKRTATSSQATRLQKAVIAASAYLRSTLVTGDHWEAWGDVDVNGTAYAAMGLKSAGANIAAIQSWLKSRLAPSGGFVTPWSNGSGDIFATAQAVAPLVGLSYLDLLSK